MDSVILMAKTKNKTTTTKKQNKEYILPGNEIIFVSKSSKRRRTKVTRQAAHCPSSLWKWYLGLKLDTAKEAARKDQKGDFIRAGST